MKVLGDGRLGRWGWAHFFVKLGYLKFSISWDTDEIR